MEYYSFIQTKALLCDTTFLFCELGRGSGKTTHILAPRIDRAANAMPGALMVFAAATYKSIIDNLLPGLMEYFLQHYARGMYFEVCKQPPAHFKPCRALITDWRHTISFANGAVVQFVSVDRPESMIGKNAAHLFIDEMIRIPEDKFVERMLPALRGNRDAYGDTQFFQGITGTSSTPNFETDEDWWLRYQADTDADRLQTIIQLALSVNEREVDIVNGKQLSAKAQTILEQDKRLLMYLRKGQTTYLHASSLSNVKILGIDYLRNQIKNIKDKEALYTSIFATRRQQVKDMFFGKFGKHCIYDDSYRYDRLDRLPMYGSDITKTIAADLRHYDPLQPLYIGYDPGAFTSMVVAQREPRTNTMRIIKCFYAIYPDQQDKLAKDFADFFSTARAGGKHIFLHYDRAGNQRNPYWKQKMPTPLDPSQTDSELLRQQLVARGFTVQLMSLHQPMILHAQHFRLCNILFDEKNYTDTTPTNQAPRVLIDRNECDALISSIYHTPLKRTDGIIQMDKSAEKTLQYTEQAYNSPQIATAMTYLLWGEFKQLLPSTDTNQPNTLAAALTF